MSAGVLLFAHGARDPRWAEPFRAVAERLTQARPDVPVRLAFLELMVPDIATAAAELIAAGCDRITVLPLFLGAGGHVRKDLPALIERLREQHAGIAFALQPAIGESPLLVDAMARIALESLPE